MCSIYQPIIKKEPFSFISGTEVILKRVYFFHEKIKSKTEIHHLYHYLLGHIPGKDKERINLGTSKFK